MKEIKTTLRRTRKKYLLLALAHWEIAFVNSVVTGSFTGPNKALVNTLTGTQQGNGTQLCFKAPGDLWVE